jgi:hypothetical protein
MTKLIKDFRRKLADKSVLALQKVHCISTNSDNRRCATNGAGTAYISIAHEFTPVFTGTPVPSTNKTEHHDMPEILLKVVLNTIILILFRNIIRHKEN